jgi:hypothetical protein
VVIFGVASEIWSFPVWSDSHRQFFGELVETTTLFGCCSLPWIRIAGVLFGWFAGSRPVQMVFVQFRAYSSRFSGFSSSSAPFSLGSVHFRSGSLSFSDQFNGFRTGLVVFFSVQYILWPVLTIS